MILSLLAFGSAMISVENPGVRLELFLKEIARQSGEAFHCPNYLKDEVLTASFSDQSVDVIKSQLARVIHGTWERKEDGWWLVQTSEQKKEESAWHRSLRRTMIQDIVDGAKKNLPAKEWTIKEVEAYRKQEADMRQKNSEHVYTAAERRLFRERAPNGRFASSFYAQLLPEMFPLDSMEPEFQLYGFNANPVGKNLPLGIAPQLEMLDREQFLLGQLGQEELSHSDRVVLTFSNTFPVQTNLAIYNKQWLMTGFAFPTTPSATYKADGEIFAPSKALSEVRDLFSYKSPYEPETAKYKEEEARVETIWQRIRSTYADAVNHDPLGLLQGQSWVDCAKQLHRPMLANLADSESTREPKYYVPTVTQTHTTLYTKRDDGDGWTLGRPVDPLWNRSHRLDRNLIVQYTKIASKEEEATIEEQAIALDIEGYASDYCGGIPNQGVLQFYLGHFMEAGDGRSLYVAAVRAGIQPDPRTGIIDIRKLPANALGSLQMRYLEGGLSRLVDKDGSSGICEQMLMPNGIQGIYLKVTPSMDTTFEVKDEDGDPMNLSMTGLAEVIKTMIEEKKPVDNFEIRIGTYRKLEISLCFGENSIDQSLTDPTSSMVKYTWKSLPDSIRKTVIAKMNEPPPDPPR